MWIEAVLLKDELSMLVGQFAPVAIRLGEDGELQVHDPGDVTIVPDLGLRVVCKATLHWTVLGFAVPVTLDSRRSCFARRSRSMETLTCWSFFSRSSTPTSRASPTGIDKRITDLVTTNSRRSTSSSRGITRQPSITSSICPTF